MKKQLNFNAFHRERKPDGKMEYPLPPNFMATKKVALW